MIDFYGWNTSNGRKIAILLEELGVEFNYRPVDIGAGEQFSDEFKKLNPNAKIPVIVDHQGPNGQAITVFESGAIMVYLAEKVASPLFPSDAVQRSGVMQWLMFQMGGVGPMFGQALHFYKYSDEKHPYSIDRYMGELHRLIGVMDQHLSQNTFFAGDYSIADTAIYPWIARHEWYDWTGANTPIFNAGLTKCPSGPPCRKRCNGLVQVSPLDGKNEWRNDHDQEVFFHITKEERHNEII